MVVVKFRKLEIMPHSKEDNMVKKKEDRIFSILILDGSYYS